MWWDNIRGGIACAEEYKENFRMKKENFQKLCDELRPYLERNATVMRKAVDVETQVALALYYLSDEGSVVTGSVFRVSGIFSSRTGTLLGNCTNPLHSGVQLSILLFIHAFPSSHFDSG